MAFSNERKQLILATVADDTGQYYYDGPIDGKWGPKSKEAERRFLADWGIQREEKKPPDSSGSFWDEIEYFDRDEFKCKCGGRYCEGYLHEPKEAMVRLADDARRHFGRPAHVISGLRCPRHNANEGGVEDSQHIYGEACDLRIDDVSSSDLLAWFVAQPGVRHAYAINDTNVHFDIPKGER